jgi:hypothetical protein
MHGATIKIDRIIVAKIPTSVDFNIYTIDYSLKT